MTRQELIDLIKATVDEGLAGKVLADSTPDEFNAKVGDVVSEKLAAALSAHSQTDLNPAAGAPQAVMADETTPTGVTDPGHNHGINISDCEPASTGSQAVADADAEEVKADPEVKADAEDAPKDSKDSDGKPEVKADASADAQEAPKDETKAEVKADDAEPVADSDEEDETMQNADIAALKAQIEVLTKAVAGQTTLSDADAAEMGAARLHADAAMQSVGKAAVQPFPGEKPLAYRKRIINELKCHSDSLKGADVSTIADSATLALIEKQVFADAAAFARSGAGIAKNTLRKTKEVLESGHTRITYDGAPRAWLQETDLPAVRVGRV